MTKSTNDKIGENAKAKVSNVRRKSKQQPTRTRRDEKLTCLLPVDEWRNLRMTKSAVKVAKVQNRESECEKRSAKKQNNNKPKREETKKLTSFGLTNWRYRSWNLQNWECEKRSAENKTTTNQKEKRQKTYLFWVDDLTKSALEFAKSRKNCKIAKANVRNVRQKNKTTINQKEKRQKNLPPSGWRMTKLTNDEIDEWQNR